MSLLAASTIPPTRTAEQGEAAAPAPITTAQADPALIDPGHVTPADPGTSGTSVPRRLNAVPDGSEARGFVLYVGIDEEKARGAGTTLAAVVSRLKELAAQLVPSSETYAAVALAPAGSGGRDIDVVRRALHDPSALSQQRSTEEVPELKRRGVVIDLSRKRLLLNEDSAGLTYKEFELLQYLVLREGRTIERAELITSLWPEDSDEAPNERTIDVHVRRLRSKLGNYEDIVRTVRGVGYRFDRHADVSIRYSATPSPDVF